MSEIVRLVEVKVLRKLPVDPAKRISRPCFLVKHDKFDRFGVGTHGVPLTGSEADDVSGSSRLAANLGIEPGCS